MSKLCEILKENIPMVLIHKTIGTVVWCDLHNSGFALYFAKGIEVGTALVVDYDILFSDDWEILDENINFIEDLNKHEIWIIYNKKSIFVSISYGSTFDKACDNYFKTISPDLFDWKSRKYLNSKLYSSKKEANNVVTRIKKE